MPAFAALSNTTTSTGMAMSDVPPNGSTSYVAGSIKVKFGTTTATSAVQTTIAAPSGCTPTTTPFRMFQIAPRGAASPAIRGWPRRRTSRRMLVGLGDGSVRSLSPSMSEWTYWAAVTPAGNETLYSDW